jgi:hypothetical protein
VREPDSDHSLQRAHDEGERLRGVVAHTWPTQVVYVGALTLTFDSVVVVLVAEQDDSLTIADPGGWQPEPDLVPISLAAEEPWRLALGKPLLFTWSMTNQFGYRDGLQLEFAEDVTDTSVVIQLVVMASTVMQRWADGGFESYFSAAD